MRLNRSYRDEVTMWLLTGGDDGYGKETVSAPVTFFGRWEERQQEFIDSRGEQAVSRAVVFLPKDASLQLHSWIYLGKTTAVDPRVVSGAFQIRAVSRIPDIRNLVQEQVAMV